MHLPDQSPSRITRSTAAWQASPFSQTFTQSGASARRPSRWPAARSRGTHTSRERNTVGFTHTDRHLHHTARATDSNRLQRHRPTYTLTITCQTITVTIRPYRAGVARRGLSARPSRRRRIGRRRSPLASRRLPQDSHSPRTEHCRGRPTKPARSRSPSRQRLERLQRYGPTIADDHCQTITVTNPA